MPWGAATAGIGAAGDLIGGAISASANAKEASKNRDWQAIMAGTAHQRQVADMRAAGLNPILSGMGGSGASSGSGAQASMPDMSNIGSSAVKSYGSGMQAKLARQQVQINEASAAEAKVVEDDLKGPMGKFLVRFKSMVNNKVPPGTAAAFSAIGSIPDSWRGLVNWSAKQAQKPNKIIDSFLGKESKTNPFAYAIRAKERSAKKREEAKRKPKKPPVYNPYKY